MITLPHGIPLVQPALPFLDPGGSGLERPTAGPDFAPSAEDEAARLGFELVMEGEDPAPPEGWEFRRLVAFYGGVSSALMELAGMVDDFEAWVNGLPDPEPHWTSGVVGFDPHHPGERVEVAEFLGSRLPTRKRKAE